jgi:hypothetical protein
MKKITNTLLLLLFIFVTAGCEVAETPGRINDDSEKPIHIVTFEIDGEAVHSESIQEGLTVDSFTPPLEDNHSFENWYIDEQFTTIYTFSTTIGSDLTLYGKTIEEPMLDGFNTIRDYLFNNGEYRYINEPGREVTTYKIETEIDDIILYLTLEILTMQPENKESITISMVVPEKDGWVGLYVGMSGTKEEYEQGVMHVFDGGILDIETNGGTWHGLDCENYDITDVDSTMCTTFTNDQTINDYFFALKSDYLNAVLAEANNYFEGILGVPLKED